MDELIMQKLEAIEQLSLLNVKKMLDINETAKLTGLSVGYLYKLTSQKKIPHYKPNAKLLYFNRAEIEEWMMQGKVMTDDEIERIAQTYATTGRTPQK